MKTQIKQKTDEIQDTLIKSLQDLVKIESVKSTPTETAPYGPKPKEALETVLALAASLGFETKNIDNKVGYAQMGKGEDYFGIFGHVDVVPLGEVWIIDPYGSDIADGKIYGRGVLDNKGPILSNLYALYVLKEMGMTYPLPIRIVFGTDEESGFDCVKHYLNKEKPPIFGWTPDCKWPAIYGERGRAQIRIENHTDLNTFYTYLNDFILSAPNNGVKLGINFVDEDFGMMILRGYQLKVEDDVSYFQFEASYPAITSKEEIVSQIEKTLPEGLSVSVVSNWDPVLYDKTSDYAQTLKLVYEETSGLDGNKPF